MYILANGTVSTIPTTANLVAGSNSNYATNMTSGYKDLIDKLDSILTRSDSTGQWNTTDTTWKIDLNTSDINTATPMEFVEYLIDDIILKIMFCRYTPTQAGTARIIFPIASIKFKDSNTEHIYNPYQKGASGSSAGQRSFNMEFVFTKRGYNEITLLFAYGIKNGATSSDFTQLNSMFLSTEVPVDRNGNKLNDYLLVDDNKKNDNLTIPTTYWLTNSFTNDYVMNSTVFKKDVNGVFEIYNNENDKANTLRVSPNLSDENYNVFAQLTLTPTIDGRIYNRKGVIAVPYNSVPGGLPRFKIDLKDGLGEKEYMIIKSADTTITSCGFRLSSQFAHHTPAIRLEE